MLADTDICSTASHWDSFNPVIPVVAKSAYFTLPAFLISSLTWAGASYIAIQFDYTTSANCSLVIPAKPNGVNFILCIRWRKGTTVYRYKLWDHLNGVLSVPMYNGELVGKNFVLEVWTVSSSTTVELVSALNILTSFIAFPNKDCCCNVDVNDNLSLLALVCSGVTLFNAFPVPIPFPNTSCEYWSDNVGNFKPQQLVA